MKKAYWGCKGIFYYKVFDSTFNTSQWNIYKTLFITLYISLEFWLFWRYYFNQAISDKNRELVTYYENCKSITDHVKCILFLCALSFNQSPWNNNRNNSLAY